MEILIILAVIVVFAAAVFFQMKGQKAEVLNVSVLAQQGKKAPKKQPKVEKRAAEEWDKVEVVKRDASPNTTEKRKKKAFDPVAEGLKAVQVKKEEVAPVVLSAKEEKSAKKRLAAEGFAMAKPSKPVRQAKSPDAEGETKANEPEKTAEEAHLEALKAFLSGQGRLGGNRNENSGPNKKKEGSSMNAKEVSHEELQKRLNEARELKEKEKSKRNTANAGGVVKAAATAPPTAAKKYTWGVTKKADEEAKEDKPEASADAEADVAADEPAEE